MLHLTTAFFCTLIAYFLSDSAVTAYYDLQQLRFSTVRRVLTLLLIVITAPVVVVLLGTATLAVCKYLK